MKCQLDISDPVIVALIIFYHKEEQRHEECDLKRCKQQRINHTSYKQDSFEPQSKKNGTSAQK